MDAKWLAGILSFLLLVGIIELVRRGKLTFKYAIGWIMITVVAIVSVIFNQFVSRISQFFGFELPSNFIFFTLLCFFVFLSILLTVFLCQQNIRNDTMAQKIGILEMELSELKDNLSKESRNEKAKS